VFRRLTGVLAVAAFGWSLAVWLFDGFSLSIGARTISSNDPLRPLLLAVLAGVLHLWQARLAGVRAELAWLRARARPAPAAALLAVAIAVLGLQQSAWVVGGADAYSYVSQADLWLRGELETPMPLAAAAPWPKDLWVFSPFGYRPSVDGTAVVPVTAPGLSLIMAGFKLVAGHCALFWVVPIAAGVLVWTTFLIGRRLGSERAGLAAAWLVATSPAVLAMTVSPMSDVPTAIFWALAVLGALGETRRSALGAGLATSIAILMRPNLAPLAVVLGAWILWRRLRASRDLVAPLLYAAGAVPGCLAIAWVNDRLYGSPLASGYGTIPGLFTLANVPVNFSRYGTWFVESQSPLALAGLAAILVPVRAIWRTPDAQARALLAGAVAAVVCAMYFVYRPFEDWWYLRYLLVAWPSICVGCGVVFARLIERPGAWSRAIAVGVVLAIGIYGVSFAVRRGAFPSGEGDYRYAAIAALVDQTTPASSVIITSQHAGPIRYYAGRLTLRFDALDPAWLDRAVDWLASQGRQPYILVEDWERPQFDQRFAGRTRLRLSELAPVAVYQAYRSPDTAFLYDPLRSDGPTLRPPPVERRRERCVLPK
jgi:hypothetical protein